MTAVKNKTRDIATAVAVLKAAPQCNSVSTFGVINTDGNVYHQDLHGPCHASLGGGLGTASVLWTTAKGQKNKTLSRFYEWLVSPESPYAPLFESLRKNSIVGDDDLLSTEFVAKYGFILPDMDLPGNLIGNFCIATRQYLEYKARVEIWEKLVGLGIDPALSFVWCGYGAFAGGTVNLGVAEYYGHSCFDMNMAKDVVENFTLGKQAEPIRAFAEGKTYRPCNVIWGSHPDYSYITFIDKEYIAVKKKAKRAFDAGEEAVSRIVTWDRFVEILKAEEKRIKG